MKKNYTLFTILCFLSIQVTFAQTPFTATWSLDGNLTGVSSTTKVTTTAASLAGVTITSPYPAGQTGSAVGASGWPTTACPATNGAAGASYLQVTASPVTSVSMVLSAFSFYYDADKNGPSTVYVRYSVDGYGTDIFRDAAITTTYKAASISLSALPNQPTPITFRIYGCAAKNGANIDMRLDEVKINASNALPVTLLSFTAKPEGDRVQLAWATTSEQGANRFVVERSTDLGEYTKVGEVAASGTTATRQYYGLTDMNPLPGNNYYRLKQIDHDGTPHLFKAVSAVVGSNDVGAVVYPNPVEGGRIHLRLWNADDAAVRLLTVGGKVVDSRLERSGGEADLVPLHALPTGLYLVEVMTNGQKRISKIMVR